MAAPERFSLEEIAETARGAQAGAESVGKFALDAVASTAPSEEDVERIGEEGITKGDVARLALELGLGVGGAALLAPSGGASAAALPLGRAALLRATGAFGGEFAGSQIAETFDPTEGEDPVQRAKKIGVGAAAGEGVLGTFINKAISGGTRLISGGKEFIEDSLAQGLLPSPGRASTNRAVDVSEGVSQSSLFGGGRLSRAATDVSEFFDEAVQAFVAKFRTIGSREATEDLVKDTIVKRSQAFRSAGASLYGEIDELIDTAGKAARVAGAQSDVARVTAIVDASEVLKAAGKMTGEGLDPSAAQRIAKLLSDRIPPDGKITFKMAHDIRSELLGIGRQTQDLIAGKGQALGKRLSPLMDAAMEKAAKKAGGGILTAWRNADAFWKEGAEVFNSKLMKSLTRDDPRSVFAAMSGANPRVIRQVRKTIDDPALWQNVQGEFLASTMKSAQNEIGEVSGKKFLRLLKNFGDEGLNEMFSKPEIAGMRRLARNLDIAQGGIGKDVPGRIFIQLAQAGAVGKLGAFALGMTGLTGARGAGAAAAILVTPSVAARLFTNPNFIKWATLGTARSAATKQRVNAFSQMVGIAIAEGARILGGDELERDLAVSRSVPNLGLSATTGGPRRPAQQ